MSDEPNISRSITIPPGTSRKVVWVDATGTFQWRDIPDDTSAAPMPSVPNADLRKLAEQEFAIICSAGGTDNLDELFGDHHLAFARIWALASESAIRRCLEAVEGEPELPGAMPDEVWDRMRDSRQASAEMLRSAVRATKKGISAKLTSLLSETPK